MTSYKDINDMLVEDISQLVVGEPARVGMGARLDDAVDAIVNRPGSRKVYVVDGEGKLVGTVTLETILRQVGYIYYVRKPGLVSFFRFLRDILKEDIAEFMEKSPAKVTKKDRVLEALRLMVQHHLNDLPVVDEENVLIGELNGLGILMRALKKRQEPDPSPM